MLSGGGDYKWVCDIGLREFSWSGPAIIFVVGELNITVLLFISFNRTYASEEMASITTHHLLSRLSSVN